MYYPIQIPYILDSNFSRNIQYSEEVISSLRNFAICLWESKSISSGEKTVKNVIVADGCIDLVVDYDGKQIGFSGMSRTNFHFRVELPSQFFGVRLKPGAFYQLTGLPATVAMDRFLPIEEVYKDFDREEFFSLSFLDAKEYMKEFFTLPESPDQFTKLFDDLSENIPETAGELYEKLHFSPRQCQRLFMKHFGLTPQMVLSILRFQKCLSLLTSKSESPDKVLAAVNYYDQSHFIKDFKKNIGLTPFELLKVFEK